MKVIVTGGSGFIGTRLVDELLMQNHEVIIYDKVVSSKYPSITIIGDVRNTNMLSDACTNVDCIYNLAAEHADNVTPQSLYEEVNIGGAVNVVAAAKANNIRNIVFTSTVAVYGLNRGEPDEGMNARPFNEYGRTKHEAELIFKKWLEESSDRSLTIVRPAVIFGESNRGNVYNLINQISSGRFVMIGSGSNKKSMGYVGNIAKFLSLATNSESGLHLFNYADKPDLSSLEIIKTITSELGMQKNMITIPYFLGLVIGYAFDILAYISKRKFSVSSIRVKKFAAETTINTLKLNESGFTAPYTLQEGLARMIKKDFS